MAQKPVGVLRFLGTNCDADILQAYDFLKTKAQYIWWSDHFNEKDYCGFILPGGFSYGDYLRCGAIAARTPAMQDVVRAAGNGMPVLGICNGFQILCEAGLLEGALSKNTSRMFQEEWVELEPTKSSCFWEKKKSNLKLPIAHSMGRYVANEKTLHDLEDNGQIWLKYKKNPNGALKDIAGICNKKGNVAGLMPHPERAMESWMGSSDGRNILGVLS